MSKVLTVGINARDFQKKHFSEDIITNYFKTLCSWLRHLKETTPQSEVFFFSFCNEEHQSDLEAYRKIKEVCHTDVIKNVSYKNFSELRKRISKCDRFIGTRFHSSLLAIQQLVPTITLSYGKKGHNFMRQVGLEEYSTKIEELTSEKLKEKWDKLTINSDGIKKKLKSINNRQILLANQHFQLIKNELIY